MNIPHQNHSIAIIGAGLSGISCAVALGKTIGNVTVFEAEAQPGGRMISRQQDGMQFDSGAQYFTVRSDAFRQQVKEWLDQWLIDEWPAWLVDLENGEALSHEDGAKRYIGRPMMHSFIQDMAELCDVRYETKIKKIGFHKKESRWELIDTHRKTQGSFDTVIVAVPAPQAVPLLSVTPALTNIAETIVMTATWTLMVAFDEPLQFGFDGAYVLSEELAWIVRDSGKIERDGSHGKEVWVIHASPEWSEKNKKLSTKKVNKILLDALGRVTGRAIPKPHLIVTELWPHAKPVNPLTEGCLYDRELRIGACGDWCCAARVEGAYLSGLTLAARVLHDA
ncbi:MAG: FAD-dependent oxidoreductase [Gammaproteobacteria bacterium]|nr:FAD-dependent oxidoreductase [Gammaproteobacteria bacterium]